MSKRAPSTTQLLVIAAFALSCFCILLFLWITFGGPTPFKARSYEVRIPFREATQLAQQSDVRISGVSVGKVQDIVLGADGEQAVAKVNIEDKYGPIPLDTRAILRTKTLLGETYIELTPGDAGGPILSDGGTLPEARVAESVQLDEIFRTFDPKTRAAFQTWQQEAAVAIAGQGEGLSYAFGELAPAFTEFDRAFRVLDSQRLAVNQLFRNGATSLAALRGRQGELGELIRASNTVFTTAGERASDIEALFRAFPTFQRESRLTLDRFKSFALDAEPVMRQLVPVAEELSPTLVSFSRLAPQAKGFFEGLEPVIARAPTGFPALRKLFRDEFPPLLRAVDPFLRNLNPVIAGAGFYRHELAAAMANVAAMSNATLPVNAKGVKVHYLRTLGPFSPESLSTYPGRLGSNRNSAYTQPLAMRRLASGLPSFETRQCGTGLSATLDPSSATDPDFVGRIAEAKRSEEENLKRAEDFFNRLQKYAFGEQSSSAAAPVPACVQQDSFAPIGKPGEPTTYQQVFEKSR